MSATRGDLNIEVVVAKVENQFTFLTGLCYPFYWLYKATVITDLLYYFQTLDSATRQELEATLKKFAKKGENVLIKFKEDPSIIGGMIVSIGDRYVDLSTASKMKRYSNILKSAV